MINQCQGNFLYTSQEAAVSINHWNCDKPVKKHLSLRQAQQCTVHHRLKYANLEQYTDTSIKKQQCTSVRIQQSHKSQLNNKHVYTLLLRWNIYIALEKKSPSNDNIHMWQPREDFIPPKIRQSLSYHLLTAPTATTCPKWQIFHILQNSNFSSSLLTF